MSARTAPPVVATGGASALLGRAGRLAGRLLLSVAIVAAVGLLALAALPLFGGRLMIVTSGSMAPLIEAGDAAAVLATDPAEIVPGDVIVFTGYGSDRLTAHRVISLHDVDGRLHFRTQGDANDHPDPNLAPAEGVEGRFVLRLPKVGYVLQWLARPTGRMLGLVVPALLLAGVEARDLLRGRRIRVGARTRGWIARQERRADRHRGRIGVAALAVGMLAVAQLLLSGPLPVNALMGHQATVADNTVGTLDVVAPTGVTATLDCNLLGLGRGILVEWNAAAGADSYEVARSTTSGGPYTIIATPDGSATSYADTNISADTTYYYVVRTVDAGWSSENSTEASEYSGGLLCL